MSDTDLSVNTLIQALGARAVSVRQVVAIAGAPGSGKSTFADALADQVR